MKKKMKLFGFLCLLLCVLALTPTGNAEAASAKKKALKAYEKFLSKGSFELYDATVRKSDCRFALFYLDNDSVPELLLDAGELAGSSWRYTGCLYTCKKGKVKEVSIFKDPSFSYYKKKGILKSRGLTQFYYSRLSGGKFISISDNEAKRSIGSKKPTKLKFYANTAAMRKKHLK